MKALILAGGSGTRLWPLSREAYPKQFLTLNGNRSLLQQTVERLLKVISQENIIIITNEQYKFHVLSQVSKISPVFFNQILLEPVRRNTAPAIALGMKYCLEKLEVSPDEILLICPSDHVIKPEERFADYVKRSEGLAKEGYILTFGIKPLYPETGYGYIKAKGEKVGDFFLVERFTEKPDLETAKRFLKEGNFFWNSGMFAFSFKTMAEELRQHAPEIYKFFNQPFEQMISSFYELPDISIDYAVLEKSQKVVVVPMDLYWSDVGSWESVYDFLGKDEEGNAILGDVLVMDTKNSLLMGNKRLVVAVDMEDLIIVETEDAIFVTKRSSAQKAKKVVEKLKALRRIEALEHRTVYRPWGEYTILEQGPRYKIKRIVVREGEKLSLQMHYHRSEHWIVVKGTAKVTIGDKIVFIHENESVFVPKSTPHRIENPGKVPLEIIEVQNGEYLEEDDIIRFDDEYGR